MIRKSTWWLMGAALVAVVYTMVYEVDREPPPVAMPDERSISALEV